MMKQIVYFDRIIAKVAIIKTRLKQKYLSTVYYILLFM